MSAARMALIGLAALAGHATGMAAEDPGVTTVLHHAQVFTGDAAHPYADAVAIRGERILAVGAREQVEQVAGTGARRVDLQGRFLMPGMIDAHAHPIAGGITLIQANYTASDPSVPALVRFVGEQLHKHDSLRGDTLVINSLDTAYWAHAAEIDAALSAGAYAHHPIVLVGSDGHTAWANRPARIRAGITKAFIRSLGPEDRKWYGYDATLEPNGFVVDAGKSRLEKSLPAFSPEFMLRAGQAAVHYLNGFGITGWLDAAAAGAIGGAVPLAAKDPGFLPVYRELGQRGELTAHVAAYPVVQPDLGTPQIEAVEALRAQFQGVPNLSIPGLKVFADGVVEIPSQTAALTRPYSNGRVVKPLFTPAKMNALVTEAARRGLNVHIHAIGDLAVKQSLDAFEAARRALPDSSLPFSMTHVQFAQPEDIPRFAQLHVIAALQLLWAVADPSTNEEVKPYIDAGIYRWIYPARSMLDAGAEIAGASDWFVSSPNPFLAIAQAETRRGPQGVLEAAERMPREAMLYAYTHNAAEVLGQQADIGTLAPGKRADMVLVDRDVLTVTPEELRAAKVLWTMFGGRIVAGQGL